MSLSLTSICLLAVTVPAAISSVLGYACTPRRATKTYLCSVIAVCLAVAAAWMYWPDSTKLPNPHGPGTSALIGSVLIVTSLALIPATAVYLCVSGAVAGWRIWPLALAASLVALPPWLWLSVMILHNVMGGL